MRPSLALAFWSALIAAATAVAAPPGKNAGSLYLMTITVGTHDPKGTPDDWNFTGVELDQIVKAHCSHLFHGYQSNLVKGSDATHDGVLKGFEWVQNNVKEKDLAIIYIGSHGGSSAKRGFCLYANGGTVYGDEIKPILARVKGRVLLVIQACCAGDILIKHGKDIEAMPKNVAAVCACRADQHSHGIMLPPIMEALHGWADADKDGIVTIGEFLRYVNFRIGTFYPEKLSQSQQAVTSESKDFDLNIPLAKVVNTNRLGRDVVMAEWKGDWYGGIVDLKKKDPMKKGRVWIHFFDDLPQYDDWVEKERICPHGAEPVDVKSGKKWYPAALLGKEGERYRIRFAGVDGKEEVVGKDRIMALSLLPPGGNVKKDK